MKEHPRIRADVGNIIRRMGGIMKKHSQICLYVGKTCKAGGLGLPWGFALLGSCGLVPLAPLLACLSFCFVLFAVWGLACVGAEVE